MEKWNIIPNKEVVDETIKSIQSRGINVILVNNKKEAVEKIKELIPAGSEVMTGSSTTLEQAGFMDYLNSKEHKWINMHAEIAKENNSKKRADLRRKAVTSDYFLASVNSISKNGELVACDQTGSRVTAFPYAAKKLILVAGVQKIADNLEKAMKRVREYVLPLENERAMKVYGAGSSIGKWVIIEKEAFKDRTTLILVKEKLGF